MSEIEHTRTVSILSPRLVLRARRVGWARGRRQMSWFSIIERRQRRQAQVLRRAVAELPAVTQRAMLAAIDSDQLIVGAYTDRLGRACPMLAAHRRGARTDVGRFPRAWDAFAGASRPRLATRRELDILRALLEESIASPAATARGTIRTERVSAPA